MQPNPLIYHKNMQIPKVSWTCFACNILCVCCVLLQVCRQTEIRWSWIDELRKQNEEQDRQGLWHGVSRLNRIMLQMLCRCRLKLCTYGPPAAVFHAAEEPYTRKPLIDVRIDILGDQERHGQPVKGSESVSVSLSCPERSVEARQKSRERPGLNIVKGKKVTWYILSCIKDPMKWFSF